MDFWSKTAVAARRKVCEDVLRYELYMYPLYHFSNDQHEPPLFTPHRRRPVGPFLCIAPHFKRKTIRHADGTGWSASVLSARRQCSV